jgi:hypothetical protein
MDFLLRISVFGDVSRPYARAEQGRVEGDEAFEDALAGDVHINIWSTLSPNSMVQYLEWDSNIFNG